MKEVHVLCLGAGVQSTTVYLLDDLHLDWLERLGRTPILRRTVGKLGNDLIAATNSRRKGINGGGRFASIPAFTAFSEGEPIGIVKRQCTKEYKIEIIQKTIRREILGLPPGRPVPKDVLVHQHYGISFDERSRASRIYERYIGLRSWRPHFPLLDRTWTRSDCLKFLETRVPQEVPKSACVFCPFHRDSEWRRLKETDSEGWARAVEIDSGLRRPGAAVNRKLYQKLYLHKSCRPLAEIDFENRQTGFDFGIGLENECEGGCGV